jgi:hypothetical protein
MDEAELNARIDARVNLLLNQRQYLPILQPGVPADSPFMAYSTVAASDIMHPRYFALCKLMGATPVWHRKQWEWVFLAHHLADFIKPGMRGVGFGCGTEPLPAFYASLGATIVATDFATDQGQWSHANQWSDSVERLLCPNIIPDSLLRERVSFRPADMNAIPDDLRDFDFTWSSCAFEHLGSLQNGMDFVVNSIKTLRPGGVAVHTTEFNLSSNDDTIDSGDTVLYRQRDMEHLIQRLRDDGHTVDDFTIAPTAYYLDNHVDVPPYMHQPHLKLRLAGFTTTSVGVVVRKGG